MAYPESISGAEEAIPDQLQGLYGATSQWLVRHGVHEQGENVGQLEGTPIYEGGEDFVFDIAGSTLRDTLPTQAAILGVGDWLRIEYRPEHLISTPNVSLYIYQRPTCQFYIHKLPELGTLTEAIYITPMDGGIWRSSKVTEYPIVPAPRLDPLPTRAEISAQEEESIVGWKVEGEDEIELSRLGRQECAVLKDIIDSLDDLVARWGA